MLKNFIICTFLIICVTTFSQETSQSVANKELYRKAEFPGGNEAFQKEFMNMVHAYIDSALYALQGDLTFVFAIDKSGKATISEVLPKFKNNEMFLDDVQYALKKVKKKWKPAIKNGLPVESSFVMRVRFGVNAFDHD